jgi:hypothetical protein
MEHQNDLIGIRIRKRSQKHRIDNAENRGAGADAQGKSDYSGGGEGGRLSQHANAVSYVLGEILNPVHTPSVAALFFDLVYRSKFPLSPGPSLGLSHTRGDGLVRELLDMHLNLALKFRVGIRAMQQGMNPSFDDPNRPHKIFRIRRFG